MGSYFSASEKQLVHPVAQHQRRDLRVKARMTVKELRELVAQAESSGEDVGVLILSKTLLKGNFEVMDRPEPDEDGMVREVMKKVDTIKEE